jgi:pimeloyl-ACP methyl ester carboxylesterase
MRLLLTLIAIAAGLYLAACAALYFFQRSLIYYPHPPAGDATSRTTLRSGDVDLVITIRERAGPGAVVYFGGNAEDVSGSLPELARAFPDRALYLMNYRGYGGSAGAPAEAALQADGLALFDMARRSHEDIVVVGRSLGSGIAVRLAAQRPVSRLVLVTPYDSLQGLAAAQFPLFPVRWLLQDKFESGRHAPAVTAPTTIVQAEHDEVIPGASTQALAKRFRPGVATLTVVPGTGHNTVSGHPLYVELLRGPR